MYRHLAITAPAMLLCFVLGSAPAVLAQGGEYDLSHDERRTRVLARIGSVDTGFGNAAARALEQEFLNLGVLYAGDYRAALYDATTYFADEVGIISALSSQKLSALSERALEQSDFAETGDRYEQQITDLAANHMVMNFAETKRDIDTVILDNFISQFPDAVREQAQKEFVSEVTQAQIETIAIDMGFDDAEFSDANATGLAVGAIAARRLIANNPIVRRTITVAARRIVTRFGTRAAAAVIAPIGEWCGGAWLLCEAGLAAMGLAWDTVQLKSGAREQAATAFRGMADTAEAQMTDPAVASIFVRTVAEETRKLGESYKEASVEIIADSFDALVYQGASFDFEATGRQFDGEEEKFAVIRNLSATYGKRYGEYGSGTRFGFMNDMGTRARALLDGHGGRILDLYEQNPQGLRALIAAGAGPELIQTILSSDRPGLMLSNAVGIVRMTGNIRNDADGQAVIGDLIELGNPIALDRITPAGFAIAAENQRELRAFARRDAAGAAALYAGVLSGELRRNAVKIVMTSDNPSALVALFQRMDETSIAYIAERHEPSVISDFAASFPPDQARAYLDEDPDGYLRVFGAEGGGAGTVRALARLAGEYGGRPPVWLGDELLWIRSNIAIDAAAIDKPMMAVAHDTTFLPNILRAPVVSLGRHGGWTVFLYPLYGLAALFVLWLLVRARRIWRDEPARTAPPRAIPSRTVTGRAGAAAIADKHR